MIHAHAPGIGTHRRESAAELIGSRAQTRGIQKARQQKMQAGEYVCAQSAVAERLMHYTCGAQVWVLVAERCVWC